MTGIFLLDWAIQAASLFNLILLIWLGLTVLLNAERLTGGILLAGGGLLMGGAFFISHSAILGHDPTLITSGLDFWWYLGWAPVVFLPFAWYLVMLWYTGFWEARRAVEERARRLYRRQRLWLGLTLLFGLILVILLFFTHLLPSFSQMAQLPFASPLSAQGIPLPVLVYPIYALLCMGLSLDALLNPGPSQRWLGELARRRAQPWLVAASLLLLVVSLLVGWTMVWIVLNLERGIFTSEMITGIGTFDLVIAGLIGVSVIVLGQAVVSYEIFTARTLPRNGLHQHWRRALVLATGYSLVVSWSLAIQLRPIYSLLLTTLLMTVFFAMLAWRSYAERERFMRNLRPFMGGGKVYSRILDPGDEDISTDVSISFQALCKDILETRQACLSPLGVMIPLAGPPMLFPDQDLDPIPPLAGLAAEFHSPQEKGLPLDPNQQNGFIWAVPLWSEPGLVGVLLLGEKRTGGLYTQEEIETARAVGERLIDLSASAELARRLAMLERQHLSHNQVMDQQARRFLHDEILPLVHTALLSLASDPNPTTEESVKLLTNVHRQLSDLLHSMAATTSPEVNRLGLLGALRQIVERDLEGSFDEVDWQIEAGAESQIKALAPLQSEVLFFAAREVLRNAARYGKHGNGKPLGVVIRLECENGVSLVIEDNGNGVVALPKEAAPLNGAGTGQGLALHSTLMAVIGGSLSLDSEPGRYTRVVLSLPRLN
jgi:signal transduction histidine kinase